MKKSLTSHERLKKRDDIASLFSSADSISTKGMRVLYKRNTLQYNRILITLSRKYGNAVQRNRAKRILREIYRKQKHSMNISYDIGVLLFPGEYGYGDRYRQFNFLLRKAGILYEVHR